MNVNRRRRHIVVFFVCLFYISYRNNFSRGISLLAYAPVRDWLGAGKDAPFYMKFLAGAITGGVGSVVGNPFDVLKVRKNGRMLVFIDVLKKKNSIC